MDGKSEAMNSIAEMKRKHEERKAAMKAKREKEKIGDCNDIMVVDDDAF